MAHLKSIKEYGHNVIQKNYDFFDDLVKKIIDYVWRPTQQSTSIGLLPGNEEVADTMADEEVDNVETIEPVIAQPEDKDVAVDEKEGEPASVELDVNVSTEGGGKEEGTQVSQILTMRRKWRRIKKTHTLSSMR